tara:strand:+ start:890 stop:3220 length:2331 start_codon:yes stop_codon:yes gene_type:complete
MPTIRKNLTKSESLELILKKKNFSKIIPKFIYFTKKDYILNKKYYFKKILNLFNTKIIIRSSAINEDTSQSSNAGKYDSFIIKKLNKEEVDLAITKIIKKYKNNKDQILVQELIYKPDLTGVLFTKVKKTNSHYYEISYDKSKRTDLITSGKSNNSLKLLILRKFSKKIPLKFRKLIKIILELEVIFKNDRLDIEFCIKNNLVYILQCRPLLGNKNKVNINFLNTVIVNLKKKYNKIQKVTPNVHGKKTLLSNMSDWNPAEMIGSHPTKLALSLYSYLITDEIWAKQRFDYGYKDVRPNRLMIDMAGSPYIDLRVDFNSFLPKNLPVKISKKIVDNSINLLKKNPSLHDKIEFEIIDTCFNFGLNKNEYNFLSFKERNIYFNELKELTNNILDPEKNLLNKELAKLKTLENKIEKIRKSNLSYIQKIFFLLNDCKELGTLPFAGIARCAFISTNILRSLKKKDLINKNELNNFYKSINTVSKNINNEYYNSLKKNNFKLFLKKYGHLRPSMYSISVNNYKKNFKKYFSQNLSDLQYHSKATFKLDTKKTKKLNDFFFQEKLVINFSQFIKFAKQSIEYRELAKLIFSKSINEIFENLIKLSKEIRLKKEDLEHIDITMIITAYNNLNQNKFKKLLLDNIKINKKNYNFSKLIKIPDVITNSKDFDYFNSISSTENYITDSTIASDVLNYSNIKNFNKIQNSIILIENADPGYDFLFSNNISGLITKYGGSNSHMAIRCMELNIPAIIGIGEKKYSEIINAKKLFLDCKNNNYKIIL